MKRSFFPSFSLLSIVQNTDAKKDTEKHKINGNGNIQNSNDSRIRNKSPDITEKSSIIDRLLSSIHLKDLRIQNLQEEKNNLLINLHITEKKLHSYEKKIYELKRKKKRKKKKVRRRNDEKILPV